MPGDDNAVCVFTLGSCQPPRNIGIRWQGTVIVPAPVMFSHSLHWSLEQRVSGNNNIIIVFDTMAESFRQMRSPVHGPLFEMDGMLAIYSSSYASATIDIWVSHDHKGDDWTFKYQVELPVKEMTTRFQKFDIQWMNLVVASWDGDVHVMIRSGPWLLQIDINGKVVASFHHKNHNITRVFLKQTLVPHTFFPTLEGYVVNNTPFV
jgi:hypothetical protein